MTSSDEGPERPVVERVKHSCVDVILPITVGQFVKLAGLAVTGGDAKQLVAMGSVRVNGEVERRRGRKLAPGDIVNVGDAAAAVALKPLESRFVPGE